MVAAVKWAGASTARTLIDLDSPLTTLTLSAVGAELANQTNLDTWGWFELTTSDDSDVFASAVATAGSTVDIYMVQALDGTNYQTPDEAAIEAGEFQELRVASIPIATEINNLNAMWGPILLPPASCKFYLYNNTDQTMTAEWELNLYTNNFETQ